MKKLKDINQIISDTVFCVDNLRKARVYFLIKDNDIIYIGQTINLINRVQCHSVKDYDSISFVDVNMEEDINEVEASYIIKYNPIHNKTIPSNNRYISISKLRAELTNYYEKKVDEFVDQQNAICFKRRNFTYIDSVLIDDKFSDEFGISIHDFMGFKNE